MIYHEYNPSTGFLIGWYEAGVPRPNSTAVPPTGIAPNRARYVNGAWTDDGAQEAASLAANRTTRAWAAANAHAQAGMDDNARASLLWLSADPECPAWRQTRINAVQAWWSAVWTEYATVKARIQAGEDAIYDPAVAGSCPFTIWQINAE